MPCVADCLSTYQCNAIRKPLPGAVYAPYVRITIATGGVSNNANANNNGGNTTNLRNVGVTTISQMGVDQTVGNKSSPATGNHAVIKSFIYGGSNGQGCEVEMYDEQGSEFSKWMENLSQSITGGDRDYKMLVDFGWIIRKCDGSIARNWVSDNGGRLTFIPMKCEAEYSGGKIKFKIVATDLLSRVSENRIDNPIGNDRQKVRMVRAIRQAFARNDPAIPNVDFLRQTASGPVPFGFKNSDGGKEGPMSTWPADQQNVLAAARKWLTSVTTDRNKGIRPTWDAGNPKSEPAIIFWEDATPGCNENSKGCDLNMGTYIVNGGDCSPVISFNPKVEFNFWANANSGGNLGSGTSQRAVKSRISPLENCREVRERRPVKSRTGGIQTQMPPPQNDMGWRPPELVVPRMQQAVSAHLATAAKYEHMGNIECELKIQGDPRFVHPRLWQDHTVSIIVINPMHIVGSGRDCGDWLAQPACNSIYSQKDYRVMEVSHEIKEGAYTTTIKVRKDAPNIPGARGG